MKTPIMITSNTNKQNKSQQQNILCSVASYARVRNSTEVHYTTATSITSRQDKVLPRRSSRNSANAKHAVNESWLTLTNPHFVEHLCREEQEDEQRALDLPSAHPPYVPAGCTNSEEEPGRQRDNLFTPHAPPSIEDLLEGLEHKNKRKRVSFSL